MNKVVLVGRVTKDIELRSTQSGTSIIRFTLAVDRRKKDDPADFISCIAFSKIAELIAQYVHKADRLGVSGRIQTGSYVNKEGQKIYTTDVAVDEIEFIEKKATEEKSEEKAQEFVPVVDDEDLPF